MRVPGPEGKDVPSHGALVARANYSGELGVSLSGEGGKKL